MPSPDAPQIEVPEDVEIVERAKSEIKLEPEQVKRAPLQWHIEKREPSFVAVAVNEFGAEVRLGYARSLQGAIDAALEMGCPKSQLPLELVR